MKHIISYSGGITSFMSAVRVAEKHGIDDLLMVFTDTMTEDSDLYRFLVETAAYIENVDANELLEYARSIPQIEHNREKRLEMLKNLAEKCNNYFNHFLWLQDGRDVWGLFEDRKVIGNTLIGACTYTLKKVQFREWLENEYSPEECIIYLGMDWTEMHRVERAKTHWKPYRAEFPMSEEPYLDKSEMLKSMELDMKIERSELYKRNFPHNNCGGFCVKTGQGNFINLYKNYPERFKFHEEQEQKMREIIGKDVSILTRTVKGQRESLPLKKLREEYERKPHQRHLFDMQDIGGCGCFID